MKLLPARLRRVVNHGARRVGDWRMKLHLAQMRRSVRKKTRGSVARCCNYTVRINNGLIFYLQYKDIFVRRIYHFEAHRRDPLILDCGSNIGMSILYFKRTYPHARIMGFEPDPAIFRVLEENIARNGLRNVQLVQAALSRSERTVTLFSDGAVGSCLVEHLPSDVGQVWQKYEVPCVRLRSYLTEPVDFLKMNIEGAEWETLADSEDRLRQVREIVIEYHHHPGLPRTLHKILALLHRQGFEYLVNDFDSETNNGVGPPFTLTLNSRYYLLVYARQSGEGTTLRETRGLNDGVARKV